MDRRTFIGAFAGGLVAAPIVARAQLQAKVFRIGILSSSTPTSPEARHIYDALFQGAKGGGWTVTSWRTARRSLGT